MSNTIVRYLGTFDVSEAGIIASDPCYERGTWCAEHLPTRADTWHAYAVFSDEGDWGTRVKLLSIYADNASLLITEHKTFTVGVDSGQFGFFAAEHYRDDTLAEGFEFTQDWLPMPDEPWYSMCCKITTRDREYCAAIMPRATGVVSSSGFGDGCYALTVSYDADGYAVAALVMFIEDDDEEDDDDFDWDDNYGVASEEVE